MSGEGGSFSHLTYHLGGDWRVDCHTYRDSTPILSVGGGPLSLAISTRGKGADAAAVEFARALADGAREFAEEMERMHAARPADDDNDSSTGQAAGCDAA